MNTSFESGIIDGTDTQNSSSEIQKMKRKKNGGNNFNNLKSSICLKNLKLIRKKINNSNQNDQKLKTKKVKFDKNIVTIDVECWKKYNVILTAEEKTEDNGKKEKSKNKRKDKKEHISCVCILF